MFAAAQSPIRSKIETMWVPKAAHGQYLDEETKASASASASSCRTTSPLADSEEQRKASKSAIRRGRHLLAALSFESPFRPLPLRRRRHGHRKQTKKQSSSTTVKSSSALRRSVGNVTRGLRIETSSDGSSGSADVFYDAVEYGDCTPTEFHARPQRDSVVLQGITVDFDLHHHNESYETVLELEEPPGEIREHEDESDFSATASFSSECSGLVGHSYADEEAVEIVMQQNQRNLFHHHGHQYHRSTLPTRPVPPPLPPTEMPLRFLRAGKNCPVQGLQRYKATLDMRREERLDTILREPSPLFPLIKKHYPHFCHLKGKNGEPCFYEQPPKTNLKALRDGGVNLESLLRHYKHITEYQWQWCERDDLQHSIYVIDLKGIRMLDFAGESVDFVKRASAFSAQHYPERAGFVFVVNVPSWFKLIWNVVKPLVDEDTLHKIYILRGEEEIRQAMMERIPLENIPPEYGGTSMPLGESPEEMTLAAWVAHNNRLAEDQRSSCDDLNCRFCNWAPARAY